MEFGLTSNESKIYLSLLELGLVTVSTVSESTKLHRTNVYDTLKKLKEKGLVSFVKQDNITFYEASNPGVFLRLLKDKEDNLRKILPKLNVLKKLSENSSDFLSIKGVASFVESLFDLLNKNSEILVFGLPERGIKLLGARIFPFHKSRIDKKIKLKQVYSSSLKKYVRVINNDITLTRFCEDDDFNVSSIICGDEILITEWNSDVLSLKIKSDAVANHYRAQFFALWDKSFL